MEFEQIIPHGVAMIPRIHHLVAPLLRWAVGRNQNEKDSLFFISSTSHKNQFNDSAHQYHPGNAQGITRCYIGQIVIAMEYSAQALEEHKGQNADTQYPFPET